MWEAQWVVLTCWTLMMSKTRIENCMWFFWTHNKKACPSVLETKKEPRLGRGSFGSVLSQTMLTCMLSVDMCWVQMSGICWNNMVHRLHWERKMIRALLQCCKKSIVVKQEPTLCQNKSIKTFSNKTVFLVKQFYWLKDNQWHCQSKKNHFGREIKFVVAEIVFSVHTTEITHWIVCDPLVCMLFDTAVQCARNSLSYSSRRLIS